MSRALYGQLSGKYVTLTTLPVTIFYGGCNSSSAEHCHIGKIEGAEAGTQKNDADLSHFHDYFCACSGWYQCAWAADYPMLFPSASDGGTLLTVGGVSIIFLALCQTSTGDFAGDWTY